jgi:Ca2+/Na+ antiporter
MPAAANPYAPPRANVDDVARANSEAEEIREEHIKHEASVRSIGILYYISGGLLCVAALALMAGGSAFKSQGVPAFLGVVYIALAALFVVVGRGIRNLRSWARTTGIVLAAIGLLGFPLGTVLNGYILYLLLAKKGKRIFEDDYKDIIEATPHVKYRTSVLVWIFLGLLLLAIAGMLAAVALR